MAIEGQTQGVSATFKAIGELASAANFSPVAVDSGTGSASFSAKRGECELWYPVGYGKQPLYTFELTIKDAVSSSLSPAPDKVHPRLPRVERSYTLHLSWWVFATSRSSKKSWRTDIRLSSKSMESVCSAEAPTGFRLTVS